MPTTDHHARLTDAINSIRVLDEQTDLNAIARFLDQAMATGRLDATTREFLHHARALLLNTTQVLTRVLEAMDTPSEHASQQREDSTVYEPCRYRQEVRPPTMSHLAAIDPAEAWRRAHLHLPGHDTDPILIHIREFKDGYQVIPITVILPKPPLVPTIETPTTLVIDKTAGTVTRWPLLPLDVLARQYRRYQRQEPMTFDEHLQ